MARYDKKYQTDYFQLMYIVTTSGIVSALKSLEEGNLEKMAETLETILKLENILVEEWEEEVKKEEKKEGKKPEKGEENNLCRGSDSGDRR